MSEMFVYKIHKSESGVKEDELSCKETAVLCEDGNAKFFSSPNVKNTRRFKLSRSMSVLLLLFLSFLAVMVMTSFAYFHVKNDLDTTKQSVYELQVEVENEKHKTINPTSKPSKSNPKYFLKVANSVGKTPFIAINFVGGNNQLEETVSGHPIRNWETTLSRGDISKFHEYIQIKVTGYYFIYAQMFFSDNASFRKNTLHFLIRKNRRKILVVASVPRDACKTVCTRYVSSVVKLKKGEDLSVASYDTGIKFNMSKDKAQFGAYLLKKAQ
ncbi:uncharacterized protein LOC130635969 [Hydractinia symbiolongicarpus]|uniref:uncharacterized protein LOC130635969 n=1 Tax=Hydractinia symbiolongicarpus TaxID=13093 RepID=UPI00254F655A|nr:uncharacterized protein LOC130635969 [Hydractinia symbiolongicarpus]